MHRFLNSLRFRLLVLVLLSTLPALGLTFYTGVQQRRVAAMEAQEEALLLTRAVASNQAAQVEATQQLFLVLSQLPEVRNLEQGECDPLLQNLQMQYPSYSGLGLALPQGEILCSSLDGTIPPNVSDRAYFQRALGTKQFVVGSYTYDPDRNITFLPFAYPVLDSAGEVESVLLAKLDLTWLDRLVGELNLLPGSALLVLDHNGLVLARYPEEEGWVGERMPNAPLIAAITETGREGTTQVPGLDGVMRLNAFTPFQQNQQDAAYVNLGIPVDVAFAEVNRTLVLNLAALLFFTLLALMAAWFIGDVLVLSKVEAIVSAARRLGAGDLSARTGVLNGEGELNRLAMTFDQMADTLQEREAMLSQAEARYRALVEQQPAVTYTAGLEEGGHFQYVSPQIETILGYSPQEWLAEPQPWSQRLHIADRERVLEALESIRNEGGTFHAEYRIWRRDGRLVWVRDEAHLVRDAGGAPLVLQGVMIDVTARKRDEASLKQYANELERSNQELQDFAYIASHDLQEPLRKIQAFGERLQAKFGQSLGEDGTLYIERMNTAAARMQTMINDLLTYSRVATRAQPHVPVNLNRTAAQVVSDLVVRIEETGGKVEVGKLPVVEAEPVQMRQLFQNLIGNALKFHRKDVPPLVKITAEPIPVTRADGVNLTQIQVKDNGIGFDEKYLDRIFQPFQRLHGRGVYEGSGIGLAVCRKIVERHGGTLTAHSTPGEGSTFLVTLPLYVEKQNQTENHNHGERVHETAWQSRHHLDGGR